MIHLEGHASFQCFYVHFFAWLRGKIPLIALLTNTSYRAQKTRCVHTKSCEKIANSHVIDGLIVLTWGRSTLWKRLMETIFVRLSSTLLLLMRLAACKDESYCTGNSWSVSQNEFEDTLAIAHSSSDITLQRT